MPLAAQFLAYFTPSEHFTHSLLQHFTPLAAQLLSHFNPSEQITPSFLNLFTPLPIGRQALTSFCPFSTIYPLTLTSFYPRWQPSSNLILTPLSNWPTHSYNILHPPPPGSPTLISLYPLWRIYSLTLTTFYHRWQPSSNFIIHLWTIDNWPTHSYNILSPSHLAAQLYFTPADQFTHSHFLWANYPLSLTAFHPPGSPTLISFYPLWWIYPLTLSTFYFCWQPSSNLIIPLWTIDNWPTRSYNISPPPTWKPSSNLILLPLNNLPPHSYTILCPWQHNS